MTDLIEEVTLLAFAMRQVWVLVSFSLGESESDVEGVEVFVMTTSPHLGTCTRFGLRIPFEEACSSRRSISVLGRTWTYPSQ
jgi:hypothetical protein